MSSHPPKSDTDNHPDQTPTDFQSLMSAGVMDTPRERPQVATDYASLRYGMDSGIPDIQHRSVSDYLVDFLTPTMIFLMVASFIFFLLDVRYVFTDQNDFWLRWVAGFFLLGIVALNRLIARDGRSESILYVITLTACIGLYTLGTTMSFGSVARNFADDPWMATFFNTGLVALLWWVTSRLTHECCVDENPSAGDIGLLTGTALRIRKAINREPGPPQQSLQKQPIIMMNDLTPYEPSEWKKPDKAPPPPPLEATRRLSKRHPGISIFYVSVPAMLVFAGGQRVLENGGNAMVRNGQFFIVIYTVAALLLLMLSSLGGLRGYFRERNIRIPAGIGPFWITLGVLMVAMVVCGAHWLPAPGRAGAVHVANSTLDERQRDADIRAFFHDETLTPEERERLVARLNGSNKVPMAVPDASGVVDTIGMIVVVCMIALALYAALRAVGAVALRLSRRWGVLGRFFAWLDRLIQRLIRIPTLPRLKRMPRVSADVALSNKYQNPFENPRMTPTDIVEYSYTALCALAEDLAVPRRPDQTPFEYIESFPDTLKSLKESAIELTSLYVHSAYGNGELTEKNLDAVRKFWLYYGRIRAAVIR